MSSYARIRVLAEVADNASYLNSQQHAAEETLTPDEYQMNQIVESGATGSPLTISTGWLTTVTGALVENRATGSGYVIVTWKSADVAANVQRLPDGGSMWIVDVDPAGTLSLESSTATAKACRLTIFGT